MKSPANNFCGLDLQRDNISLVQFSTEENVITNIFLRTFFSDSGKDIWKTWQDELSALKSGRNSNMLQKNVVCSLPSEYAQIKHCMIDDGQKDWRESVEWEMSQQILGSRNDFVMDYELAEGVNAAGTKKYLAVAYRKELVDRTVEMLKTAKFMPCIIDLDIFGLINVFEANYPDKRAAVSLLVHTERTLTKLALTAGGAFLDYLTFDHDDDETFTDALGEKIKGFLSTADKTSDYEGPNVYLSGSYYLPSVRRGPLLEKIKGSEILNPFRKILCKAGVDQQQLQEHSPQLAVAVGLALRGRE
jgi:hypothetical protein